MQDLVKDWMIDLVVYIDSDSTVLKALSIMRRRYLNSLIVKHSDKAAENGIITITDICDKIVARRQNPATTKVREIMTKPLITISLDQTIYDCAKTMREKQIHQLPVVDENKTIVGMISATDFLVVAEALGYGNNERQLR